MCLHFGCLHDSGLWVYKARATDFGSRMPPCLHYGRHFTATCMPVTRNSMSCWRASYILWRRKTSLATCVCCVCLCVYVCVCACRCVCVCVCVCMWQVKPCEYVAGQALRRLNADVAGQALRRLKANRFAISKSDSNSAQRLKANRFAISKSDSNSAQQCDERRRPSRKCALQ